MQKPDVLERVEADKEGVSAQELANRYNRVIAKDLCDLGLSYDLFTRTTTGVCWNSWPLKLSCTRSPGCRSSRAQG